MPSFDYFKVSSVAFSICGIRYSASNTMSANKLKWYPRSLSSRNRRRSISGRNFRYQLVKLAHGPRYARIAYQSSVCRTPSCESRYKTRPCLTASCCYSRAYVQDGRASHCIFTEEKRKRESPLEKNKEREKEIHYTRIIEININTHYYDFYITLLYFDKTKNPLHSKHKMK